MTTETLSLSDALDGYLLSLRSRNVSPRTVDRCGLVLRGFTTYVAAHAFASVDHLKAAHAQAYLLKRLGEVSDISAHFETTPIKAWGSWLEAQSFVSDNPFRRVKKPKMAQCTPAMLTVDETKALLASYDRKQPDQSRDYVMVSLVLATGLRRSEVCDAKLPDLAEDHRKLLVIGKGRRERFGPLSPEIAALLWRYVVTTRKRYATVDAAWLFLNRRGGPIDATVWTHRLAKQVRAAGITKRCTIYSLRHLAATSMLAAEMPIALVSRALGRASVAVTDQAYAHCNFESISAAYAKADHLRWLR